ncbi:hypothetical protein BBJ28_00006259 [Nothophytophthora sp. Chile5]|nr:hypothetical protein BBJ28_00006259 [Nothophytophthora sp. Chile5]
MERVQQQHHVEDVGRLLLQTQEQLRVMREQMTAAAIAVEANASPMRHSAVVTTAEVQAFNAILQQTEMELRAKAELVLGGMVNSSGSRQSTQSQSSSILPAVVTAAPLSTGPRGSGYSSASNSRLAAREDADVEAEDINFFREVRSSGSGGCGLHCSKYPGSGFVVLTHARLLPSVNKVDPGAATPELFEEDARHGVLDLVTRGFLPAHADLTPAFASASGHGGGADGGVMKQRATRIYDRSEQPARPTPFTQSTGYNLAALKFDLRAPPPRAAVLSDSAPSAGVTPATLTRRASTRRSSESSLPEERGRGLNKVTVTFPGDGRGGKKDSARHNSLASTTTAGFSNQEEAPNGGAQRDGDVTDEDQDDTEEGGDDETIMEELGVNVDKIRGYNELLDAYSLHQFLIHKGRAMRETPEFVSFRRVAQELWGSVEEALRALETLLAQYFVPLAYVDGQRLLTLAATAQPRFSKHELLACVVNEDQIMTLVRRPGQRYKGKDRKRRAATTLQACVRMWSLRCKYKRSRAHDGSATTIQLVWRAYSSHEALKVRLRERRREQLDRWETRMSNLKTQWSQIAARRRVVVHVPSLSLDEHSRLGAENFAVQQNLQLTRVCAAALDSHVELLVYVSPFELTADVSQYFLKLLQLGGATDSRPRVKFVFPEQAARFPTHFSLASLLLYSPHCLQRIRRYTAGKDAYLVMGLPGAEDQRLAMALDLPILGAQPAHALPLLTRSGGKRLLIRADVNVPTGTYELYDEHELFSALSKLAVAHLDQPRWLLKLDYDPFGVGEAAVDLSEMHAIRELRREKRGPEYWRQPGARDAAAKLVLVELERPGMLARLATPVHAEIFPSWRAFAEAIAQFGCVLEAVPPTPTVATTPGTAADAAAATLGAAYMRANLFVDPDGAVHVTSTQNVLTSGSGLRRKTVAYTFPQSVAPYEAIQVGYRLLPFVYICSISCR